MMSNPVNFFQLKPTVHQNMRSVWCGQHAGGMGCHQEAPGQDSEVDLCEPHEVQQGQVQVTAHGLRQSQVQIQAGWRMDGKQPWGEGLGGAGWQEAQSDPAMCIRGPEGQPNPVLHAQQCEQWGRELCHSNLLLVRHPHESCVQLWSPQHRETWSCWSRTRGGHKNGQRAGTPPLWRKAERDWGCLAWRREG